MCVRVCFRFDCISIMTQTQNLNHQNLNPPASTDSLGAYTLNPKPQNLNHTPEPLQPVDPLGAQEGPPSRAHNLREQSYTRAADALHGCRRGDGGEGGGRSEDGARFAG
jgi:hypothetical protein